MSQKCTQLITGIENIRTKQSELDELIATLDVQKNDKNIAKAIIIELSSRIYRLRKELISDIKEVDELLVDGLFFVEYSQLTKDQIEIIVSQLTQKTMRKERLRKKELVLLYNLFSQFHDLKNYGFNFSGLDETQKTMCSRIMHSREKMGLKSDLSLVKNIPISDVCSYGDKRDVMFRGGKKYFFGNFYLEITRRNSYENIKLPEMIEGSFFWDQYSGPGLTLPRVITSNLNLQELTKANGMIFPVEVGGSVFLPRIESAKDLKFPNHIGGDLHLDGLTNDDGLELPHFVGGYVYLHSLSFFIKTNLREKYPHLKIQ